MTTRHRALGAVRALVAASGTLALASCATLAQVPALPEAPPPPPATFIPEAAAPRTPATIPVGDDGFSVAERFAMRVSVETCDAFSNGSAWVLDENTVVTNRHVVEGAVDIGLTSYDGHHYRGRSSVLDEDADLALVHIDGTFPEVATIAEHEPKLGSQLTIAGYPEAGRLTSTSGEYLAVVEDAVEEGLEDVYMVDASSRAGNSGSPVVNVDGHVVGVLYASNEASLSFAVTLPSLERFLENESAHVPNEADCER